MSKKKRDRGEGRIVEVPQLDVVDILIEDIGRRHEGVTTTLTTKIHPDGLGVTLTLKSPYGGTIAKASGVAFSDALQKLQKRAAQYADEQASYDDEHRDILGFLQGEDDDDF
jgi:hypothetical protein